MMTAFIILAGASLIFLIAFDVFSVLLDLLRNRKTRHPGASSCVGTDSARLPDSDTGKFIRHYNRSRYKLRY